MRKFGLIGKTLSHSFSKAFFKSYFIDNRIEANYENVEIETIEEIKTVLQKNFSGLNVTIPYKESILPYLNELSIEAKEIGAVNVIRFEKGKTVGYNTDAFGFHQSIKPFLTNQHERAIVFGTGGASKAVEYVLTKLGVEVIFISRNPKKENEFSYEQVNENMIKACKLIVNCTPIGTFPNIDECLSLPFDVLTEHHLVIDLVYNPPKTQLLKNAEANGAMILNGESMLKHQAIKSWEIWNK